MSRVLACISDRITRTDKTAKHVVKGKRRHAIVERLPEKALEIALDCPGFVFAVGNHIPSNVPVDNAQFYFDYLQKRWRRYEFLDLLS